MHSKNKCKPILGVQVTSSGDPAVVRVISLESVCVYFILYQCLLTYIVTHGAILVRVHVPSLRSSRVSNKVD